MAFEIASTNLVIELGIILALMLGWRFTLAEFVGGPLMIVILAVLFRRFMTPRLLAAAKRQAEKGIAGRMEEHAAMEDMSVTGNRSVFAKLFSKQGMTATSHYFVMDWSSIWTDIVLGLLIAGAITAWVPMEFFQKLFLTSHPLLSSLWGPLIGPLIAVIAFVCSIGNVPLAAVLWNGGISFGGVIAFIFADLIVFPIVRIYFKYYGAKMAAFLFLTFYTAMAVAGFGVEMLFKLTGLLPQTRDATVLDPSVSLNYTTVLNVVFIALSALLVWRYMTTRMHHHHMSSHSHH
jgi:uncharacterized membrane protein YraQ (UPF0718 family)